MEEQFQHETSKLPLEVLYKKSRQEVGELQSEIDHLNSEIIRIQGIHKKEVAALKEEIENLKQSALKMGNSEKRALNKEIKSEILYTEISRKLEKTRKKNKELEALNNSLFGRIRRLEGIN